MTLGGAAIGVALSAAGFGASTLWPGMTLPLATSLGGIALVYAVHEIGLIHLPVPGRDWQVPVGWVQQGFYRSAVIFGGTVGLGVFTRVPYASLPVLFAWFFVSGNLLLGLAAGTVYGATRALSIYSSSTCDSPEDMVSLNRRIMAQAPSLHMATGLALAVFASYLLTAPYLP